MEPEGLTYYSRLLQVQVARWGGWGPHSFHSCHFYPNRNNLRYPYICIHILHMCTCSAFPSFSFSTDSTVFRWMINSQWEKQLLFRISPPPPLHSLSRFALCWGFLACLQNLGVFCVPEVQCIWLQIFPTLNVQNEGHGDSSSGLALVPMSDRVESVSLLITLLMTSCMDDLPSERCI